MRRITDLKRTAVWRCGAPILGVLLAALFVPAAHADTRSFTLANFTTVKVEGDMIVRIETDRAPAVKAEGDRRLLDRLDLRVDGNILSVRMDSANAPRERRDGTDAAMRPVTISIAAKDVHDVSLIGSGSLSIDRLTGRTVRASLYGSGSMDVGGMKAEDAQLNFNALGGQLRARGQTQDLRAIARGKGVFDASVLTAQTLSVIGEGPVDSLFTAADSARIIVRDHADVRVTGKAICTIKSNRDSNIACEGGVAE